MAVRPGPARCSFRGLERSIERIGRPPLYRVRIRLCRAVSPTFSPPIYCEAQYTMIFAAFSICSLQPTLVASRPPRLRRDRPLGDARCPYVPQVRLCSPPTLPASRVHGFTVTTLRAVRDVPILRDRRSSRRLEPLATTSRAALISHQWNACFCPTFRQFIPFPTAQAGF